MAAGMDARSCNPDLIGQSFQKPESSRDACKLGFEGIVSKRLGSPYRFRPLAALDEG